MKIDTLDPMRKLRIVVAHVHQIIGWAGFAGLALIAVASAIVWASWMSRTTSLLPDAAIAESEAVVAISSALPVPVAKAGPTLPYRSDVPSLLTLIQQAASGNGLGWAAANYRIAPATENEPSTLEVRCNFKGPYPQLRGMLAQLLSTVPALTLRELSMHRPNSDVADVDAKLVLAVFLRDDQPASSTQRREAAP